MKRFFKTVSQAGAKAGMEEKGKENERIEKNLAGK